MQGSASFPPFLDKEQETISTVGQAVDKHRDENISRFILGTQSLDDGDLLIAMTYDSPSTTSAGYQAWMQQQTQDILRAVSGVYGFDPTGHPAPTNGIKVFIGLPAFPAQKA